jgi:hypothetical protein
MKLSTFQGFDRSNDATKTTSMYMNTTTISTASYPRTSATELSSGFQPYRPTDISGHSLATSISPYSISQASLAASYGYHPAFFATAHLASPYG